jgi:RNA polymerase sigma factor (sigma-70 family)
MNVPTDLFSRHLGLADLISLEYTNIPGVLPAEALSEAQQALFRASVTFDSERGEFAPYAARAVRNALNSLSAKQLRVAKIFPRSLDDAPNWDGRDSAESRGSFGVGVGDSGQDVLREVRRRESGSILEKVLNYLSPRERVVVEGLRSGKSLTEIGDGMGISKQAAHKISAAALKKLRERLNFLGFQGLDSKGLLKSRSGSSRRIG